MGLRDVQPAKLQDGFLTGCKSGAASHQMQAGSHFRLILRHRHIVFFLVHIRA